MQPPRPFTRRFAPGKTGDAAPLGRLETAVMDAVWSLSHPVQVADVEGALTGEPKVAYNTVKTTMERLAEKGILTRVKEGKAYVYKAAISRGELERRIVATALDRLVEHFPEAVASFFVDPRAAVSDDKLALLEQAVERLRERRDA